MGKILNSIGKLGVGGGGNVVNSQPYPCCLQTGCHICLANGSQAEGARRSRQKEGSYSKGPMRRGVKDMLGTSKDSAPLLRCMSKSGTRRVYTVALPRWCSSR